MKSENFCAKNLIKIFILFFAAVIIFSVVFTGCAPASVKSGKYGVVYAEGNGANKQIALNIAQSLEKDYGVAAECYSDKASEKKYEIVVGATNRKGGKSANAQEYCISRSGNKIFLKSGSASGILAAAKRFLSDVADENTSYSNPKTNGYSDLSLKVMSFNIRTTGEDRWNRLKNVIERNAPDILGTQEVSSNWQEKLKTDLDGYSCVGESRGSAGDEAGYILFKTDKFELVENGTRWYTSTPDKPSKLEDSTYTRIYTYARLKRISDGTEFVFINTHLDLNQGARMASVKMLIDFIEEKFDLPCYITGDFNTGDNQTYINGVWGYLEADEYDADDLLEENGFNNSRLVATTSDEHHTYPSTLYPSDEKADKRIIDYCFVKGNILVDKYSVDAELPDVFTEVSGLGNDASDHYPIVCETVLYDGF